MKNEFSQVENELGLLKNDKNIDGSILKYKGKTSINIKRQNDYIPFKNNQKNILKDENLSKCSTNNDSN